MISRPMLLCSSLPVVLKILFLRVHELIVCRSDIWTPFFLSGLPCHLGACCLCDSHGFLLCS